MKQGTKLILEMELVGLELETVRKMEIIFKQGDTRLLFEYPSERARAGSKPNTVELIWEETETWRFEAGKMIKYDSKVWLTGSDFNPQTEQGAVTMSPTLFEKVLP